MEGPPNLLSLSPVPQLLRRTCDELAAAFVPGRPMRVSRAPGRLDVMGGIADYTGSLVCEMPLDRAAAVVTQARNDRLLQVFSFNLLDEHKPFTFGISLDALADASADALRRGFAEPARRWAGYIAGCLFALHEHRHVDLRDPTLRGINLALLSTVPAGAGVSSSAAIEVASMMNFVAHYGIAGLDGLAIARLCQEAENRIVGAPCGIMDQATSCLGVGGSLLRLVCQPHEILPELRLPRGVRVLGINSSVKHEVGGAAYTRTRCAAFMGHRVILNAMEDAGQRSGRPLERDPMRGYLANLDPDAYKSLFRPVVPEHIGGQAFIDKFGSTIDMVTSVDPTETYTVRQATDHHVLEARRVRRFVEEIERASASEGSGREGALRRAGRLMDASHLSYTNDALLGAPECDLLVRLIRERNRAGLYGSRITGGGSGGTVAVLADAGREAAAAIANVMTVYHASTGLSPELFSESSSGAWRAGTELFTPQ